MIKIPNCSNASIAVFGLGISGISTIKAIQRSGGHAFAWDDKETSIEKARVELAKYGDQTCEFISPHEYNWTEIKALVISPGIPTTFPSPHWVVDLARRHGCPIKCDIELFLEAMHDMRNRNSGPVVIGVTGTNGKSTTTTLASTILNHLGVECDVGGNIGIPVLDLTASKKAYVLELSSFQIELLSTSIINSAINIVILLNLTPDHMDRHGTFENYFAVKEKLLVNAKEVAVICIDSKETHEVYNRLRQVSTSSHSSLKLMPVSTTTKENVSAHLIDNELCYKNTSGDSFSRKLERADFKINLEINYQNIVSAFAAVASLLPKFTFEPCYTIKYDEILTAIQSFPGLPHRAERIGNVGHIEFINDSKSTNADSSEKTLLCFEKIFWILGGHAKGGGINSLVTNWKSTLCKIQKIFLIGESTEEFANCLATYTDLAFEKCDNLDKAFRISVQDAEKCNFKNVTEKITILLSPACASYDQWKNFEERGDAFRKLAVEYITQRENATMR